MAIKNYTSKVNVYESLGEIQAALAANGARRIMVEYDAAGQPMGVTFGIETPAGSRAFCLPANVEGVRAVMARQKVKDTEREPEEIKAILERYHAFRSAISDETGQPMVSWTRAGEICRAEKDGRLVVQKHGEWETHLLPLAWECSVCGFKNSFRTGRTTEYLNYCPCCGAKMDEEVDNEAD